MASLAPQHYVWLAIAVIAIAVLFVVIMNPAFRQTPETVTIRYPGRRLLGPPQPAQPEAAEDLDFAVLSQAAYGDITKSKPVSEEPCIDSKQFLADGGWEIWTDFPPPDLQAAMEAVHLRAEVWMNRTKGIVVVTFGGTVFSNWKDWKSNLHWLDPFQKDEYTLVIDRFAPEFKTSFDGKTQATGWEFLKSATVYATGHSLGGGLAEEFAYSVPPNSDGSRRVTRVYAFDPSPVTGFLSVKKTLREDDKRGLKIDRIYERGEVLAILRSITSTIHKPPAKNPEVRQLRYNLFGNDRFGFTNAIAGHSIEQLACGLKKAAGR